MNGGCRYGDGKRNFFSMLQHNRQLNRCDVHLAGSGRACIYAPRGVYTSWKLETNDAGATCGVDKGCCRTSTRKATFAYL